MIWKSVLLSLTAVMAGPCQLLPAEAKTVSRGDVLIIQGEPGTSEYREKFSTWGERWENAAVKGGLSVKVIAPTSQEQPQREQILKQFGECSNETELPLWIVLIGHGTFDRRVAKFNLVGPDLSAQEFGEALETITRPILFINCSSSSAPFVEAISRQERVVITATRSGDQVSFSHFGDFLSSAIDDPSSDLDKDEQVSLLEAFLSASRKVDEFYESDGRIPTENALLEDNTDQLGTRASAFRGLRAVSQPENEGQILDGFRAHQYHLVANDLDRSLSPQIIARRNEIESKVEELRLRKASLAEDQYYAQLEELFLEMANLLFADPVAEEQEVPNAEPSSEDNLP